MKILTKIINITKIQFRKQTNLKISIHIEILLAIYNKNNFKNKVNKIFKIKIKIIEYYININFSK